MRKITKAIIPVAGYGTRFLPATKAQPKEMLALLDKPVVQYLVEEAVEAGIKTIIFVINNNKYNIGDHFSRNLELEQLLKAKKKHVLLQKIQHLHNQAEFLYVHQNEPLGSGDAIMRARPLIGDEPFAIFYADDVMVAPSGSKPAIGQLMDAHERYGTSIMGLVRIPIRDSVLYGMVDGKRVDNTTYKISDVIEKPSPKESPSNLASVGRFIATPEVFQHIPKLKKKGGEIYFADALAILAKQGKLHGRELNARWHDCGSKIGFFRATVELGLCHPEIGKEARSFIKRMLK